MIAAPLVTWLPMLAYRFPALGLPRYEPAMGVDLWSAQVFWFMALALIGTLAWRTGDPWLGAAVALAGFIIFWRGAAIDPTHSAFFGLGVLGLVVVRHAPIRAVRTVRWALVGLGAFQIAYVLHQRLGYDLLWGPLLGGTLKPVIQPFGTLATVDAAGAYIAMTAPLLPLPLLPFAVYAVWVGQSIGAMMALTIGLLVRYGPTLMQADGWIAFYVRRGAGYLEGQRTLALKWALPVVLGMPALLAWLVWTKGTATATVASRTAVWGFGLQHAARTDPVLGWGLGGWMQQVPALQIQTKWFPPSGEIFREAHSEYVQWIAETGLIGLVLLVGWLWSHRTIFLHPLWGGSLAALAVNSLTFFPLHNVALALPALVMVGLATPLLTHAEPVGG